MRTAAKILLVAVVGSAFVLVWGYWYSLNHASLHLRVDDYALKSPNRAYDVPHDVRLVLRDASNGRLAVARSMSTNTSGDIEASAKPETSTYAERGAGVASAIAR